MLKNKNVENTIRKEMYKVLSIQKRKPLWYRKLVKSDTSREKNRNKIREDVR